MIADTHYGRVEDAQMGVCHLLCYAFMEHPEWAGEFTTDRFLEVAGRYFDVTHQSYLGIRPLYLMKKK